MVKFRKYCNLARYWYNQTVEYLKTKGTKASLFSVRKVIQEGKPEWAYDSPQRIREYAISDACASVKNAKLKFLRTHEFQEVKFKSKKNPKQQFGFDKKSLKFSELFKEKDYRLYFFSSENYNSDLEGCEICEENERWFLILPEKISIKKPENQRLGTVALDPGVRTFISYYSPFCNGKLGCSSFNRIYRLCSRLDKAISKMSVSDYKARKRIKKATQRLRWKIKDSINDIHHKVAYFLVTNFDRILLPEFKSSDMVSNLRSKTARAMLTWAHYRFKQFLKFKAKEYSSEVIEVSEAYTSKTCSYCGRIQNIGSKKVLTCDCGANVDRDLNGARGIYLRNCK